MEDDNLDAPLAPPIDSQPDDLPGDPIETLDDAPPVETGEPETALDAVKNALDKTEAPVVEEAPPIESLSPEEAEKARIESLYQIPHGLSGQPRKQYKALSDHARGLETQLHETSTSYEQITQKMTGFEEVLKDAGATPEVLGGHLSYMKAVQSGDLEGAMEWINRERVALAKAMGKPVDGVDLLEEFPDLKEAVDNFTIAEEYALELATQRRAQAAHQQRQTFTEQQRAEAERQNAIQQQKESALGGIDSWLQDLAKTDLDFPAKEAAMQEWLKKPASLAILAKLPPADWLTYVQDRYDSIAIATAPPPRDPTPLRPGGAKSGALPNDADLVDVVKRATGYR